MTTSRTRPLTAFLLAVTAIVIGAGSVMADTELGHQGTVGRHRLRDTAERPGARCVYDDSGTIAGLRVRPPIVTAIDVGAAVDRGAVGWFFVVQELLPGGEWVRVRHSPLQVGLASDERPAEFTRLGARIEGDAAARYRVTVRMLWLAPRVLAHRLRLADHRVATVLHPRRLLHRLFAGGHVVGVARHRVDFYRWPTVRSEEGSCPGGIL